MSVPFAPAVIVAPPLSVTVTVPFATASCTVLRLPSTSVTLMPPTASAVSSLSTDEHTTELQSPWQTVCSLLATEYTSMTALLSRLVTIGFSGLFFLLVPSYSILAIFAFISASPPNTPLPLHDSLPTLIVAPPLSVTVTVPFATASCTVLRLPSTSVTLMPPTASAVSSL